MSQSWITVGINWTTFGPLWVPLAPFRLSPVASSLICVYSGRLSEWSSVAKRRLSWEERRAPQTSRSWTSAQQHWEEAAFPGFHEMRRNCRDLVENTEKTKKNQQPTNRRGRMISGTKDNPSFMILYWKGKQAYTIPSIIYMQCRLQSRGKGVGLQLLCAREEEWVPGDVILTGRGQLSQYNGLQQKRSHRKTENAKPSPAIFSLI